MSNPDTFIDEVNEAVRRDRLFTMMRRWGWIPVLLVILLVGGAAVYELIQAREQAEAEARGDQVLAALNGETPEARLAALEAITLDGEAQAVLALLEANEAVSAGDNAAAVVALNRVAEDPAQPELYRQLATLKLVMMPEAGVAPEGRIALLEPLTAPGGTFRTLAEEQIALNELAMGDTEAARTRLETLLTDTESSQALRQRAQQLIVALGGGTDAG